MALRSDGLLATGFVFGVLATELRSVDRWQLAIARLHEIPIHTYNTKSIIREEKRAENPAQYQKQSRDRDAISALLE